MPRGTCHLVWTTYGTWLPGDSRGWVKPGALGVQMPDADLEEHARALMAEDPAVLTVQQRETVDRTIRDHCRIRGWTLHALNVRSNHIHAVLTADRTASEAMSQLKAWCSRRLSDDAGLTERVAEKAGRRHWFTEGGHWKAIETDEYLENAVRYVLEGQDDVELR